MASAREAQAARLTGWPAGRLLAARRDPVRSLRPGSGAKAVQRAAEAAAGQAQQSEVDNAITAFGDAVGKGLPEPWAGGLREAARCNAGMVPQALTDGRAAGGRRRRVTPAGLVAAGHGLAVAACPCSPSPASSCRW